MSSRSHTPAPGLSQHDRHQLRSLAAQYMLQPLLDMDDPWKARDAEPLSGPGWPALKVLRDTGAIEIVDEVRIPTSEGETQVKRWRLTDGGRRVLERYYDEVTLFADVADDGCPHAVHIHHVDGRLGCRYCDQPRDYDPALVKEAMSA